MSVLSSLLIAISLQAAPVPSGQAIDRDFLIGHWSVSEDCAHTASFNADGSALVTGETEGVRWSLAGSVITTVEQDGSTERVTARRRGERMEVTRTSGEVLSLHRCAAAAAAGQAERPLDEQLAQAVEQAQARLPMAMETGAGTVTVTAIELSGRNLLYLMTVPRPFPSGFGRRVDQTLAELACREPTARRFFEQGGSYSYRFRDSRGREHRVSVSRCPAETPASAPTT